MPTKSANNAIELNFVQFDSTNNRINFGLPISSNASAIGGEDVWVRTQANAAFNKANTSLSNTNLNVSGTLRMLNQGGDEGGEIFLDKAVSNTTLAAGVTVDVYQNKLRIYETGGGIRGAFIDIANTTANGIASEITKYDANNSSTGFLTLPIGTTAQRPANPAKGTMRFNSSNNVVEVYMPTAGWVNMAQDTFTLEYLIVAGGGGGGAWAAGGGGGAGGVVYSTTLLTSVGTSYTVTVGAGGSAAPSSPNAQGTNGSNSSIVAAAAGVSVVALGGGIGAAGSSPNGQPGGSGGGGGNGTSVGTGLVGQGYPGGAGASGYGGGGGGAGAVGSAATIGGGPGGIGVTYASFAAFSPSGYFAGGGGGGTHIPGTNASGGTGGGAAGGGYDVNAQSPSGLTNSGGGGGGAGGKSPVYGVASGAGGSGVVIIRYAGTTQRASGGTITNAGGYTYHLFTGSGTFNFTG